MATYKINFVFKDQINEVGWTHVWWTSATDAATALTQTYPYWQKVRACLMDYVFLDTIRASNVDPPRDSLYTFANAGEEHGTIDHTAQQGLGYAECLLIRRDVLASNVFGHSFMHGTPFGIFTGREWTPPAGAWTTAFAALRTEVTGGNYLLRKRTAPATYTYPACLNYTGVRMTSHRVGRPFDPLRGRRRIA